MLQERRIAIVDMVNQNGFLHFSDLTEAFPEVSEATLRKDLRALDAEQQIVRVHGGVRALSTVGQDELKLSERLVQRLKQKTEIAQKALCFLQESGTYFFDSGSTLTQFAKMIPDKPFLVFTSGLSVAVELASLKNPTIQILGGKLNKVSLSVRDSLLAEQIGQFSFDIAFLSVQGYSRNGGFSCCSFDRWAMEKSVMHRAAKTIILMDSSKEGITNPYSIAYPQDVFAVVSDDDLSEKTRQYWLSRGTRVL